MAAESAIVRRIFAMGRHLGSGRSITVRDINQVTDTFYSDGIYELHIRLSLATTVEDNDKSPLSL